MRRSKSELGVIVLLILVGVESLFYIQLQSNHNSLASSHKELKEEVVGLENQHEDLSGKYSSLQTEHQNLNQDYHDVQADYYALKESHETLQGDYSSFEQNYSDLQSDYEIDKILRIGNSLESYYDILRDIEGPEEWWSPQRDADFAADLALHDLGRNCWPSIEQEFYEDVEIHSYEKAKEKIEEIVNLIEIKPSDTSTQKIEKILEFVSRHISYEEEFSNVFLAPVETLGLKSGDCDDFSILAASLFEAVEIDAAFGIFKNENTRYHSMVLVHLDGLEGYSCWSHSDLTDFGLEEGRWIIIEAQENIENQGDEWIKQWSLMVAAPIEF